jgi:hypothetical protein
MSCWKRTLAPLLLLATLGIVGIASARNVPVNMDLKPTQTDCDGTNKLFGYVATWKAPTGAKSFGVKTANCGRVGPATCNAAGQCSAPLNQCRAGPSWVEVVAHFGTGTNTQSQRAVVPWPTDANGKKKVCQ